MKLNHNLVNQRFPRRTVGFTLIEVLLVIVVILMLAGAMVVFVLPQQKGAEPVTAVSNVTLSIRDGEVVSLIGPSGCGKTTTTMNLGVALVKSGKRVLLVDGDPQANLTSYLGVTPGTPPFETLHTLDEVYLSKRPLDRRCLM